MTRVDGVSMRKNMIERVQKNLLRVKRLESTPRLLRHLTRRSAYPHWPSVHHNTYTLFPRVDRPSALVRTIITGGSIRSPAMASLYTRLSGIPPLSVHLM
jgi:hypothetical protein